MHVILKNALQPSHCFLDFLIVYPSQIDDEKSAILIWENKNVMFCLYADKTVQNIYICICLYCIFCISNLSFARTCNYLFAFSFCYKHNIFPPLILVLFFYFIVFGCLVYFMFLSFCFINYGRVSQWFLMTSSSTPL